MDFDDLLNIVPVKGRHFKAAQESGDVDLLDENDNAVVRLNQSSKYIWDSCSGEVTAKQMVDGICAVYTDCTYDQITHDVLSTIHRLSDAGVIELLKHPDQSGSDPCYLNNASKTPYFYIIDNRPNGGLFSCLNRVLDYCHYCDCNQLVPVVWWGEKGCYWTSTGHRGAVNVFEYYFEPLSNISLSSAPDVRGSRWSGSNHYPDHELVVAPRGMNAKNLYFPNRELGCKLIRNHLKVRREFLTFVEEFVRARFGQYTIGVHIRGPERRDGGSRWMRKQFDRTQNIPFQLYFEKVRGKMREHPDAKVFVATDAQIVRDECRRQFGDRVINLTHALSSRGNDHLKRRSSANAAEIGESCLLDALILSKADYFVHGTSNVSNFVNCFNPDQDEVNVYEAAFNERGVNLRETL